MTTRELSLLGLSDVRSPAVIASALNAFLDERLERVRASWEAEVAAPLDLAPLHIPGTSGREGGGLLYHRPQARPLDDWASQQARRYHPASLPVGLLQACGHTQHKKMRSLLEHVPEIPEGALRSLWFDDAIRYEAGLVERPGGALWMVDSGLNHAARPALLQLASVG